MAWQYAGFWRRLAGTSIDALALTLVGLFLKTLMSNGAASLLDLVIGFVYYVMGTAWGGTPGKRLLRMRISDPDGNIPGLSRSLIRNLVAGISCLALFLGYFWMLWDPRKQTWHDKAAGTFVMASSKP